MKRILILILLTLAIAAGAIAQTDSVVNFGKVEVRHGYGTTDTRIALVSGQGKRLPASGYNLVWWNWARFSDPSDDTSSSYGAEIVRVLNNYRDTLTVLRAQEGTTAKPHNLLNQRYKMILAVTAKTITDLQAGVGTGGGTVDTSYAKKSWVQAYVVGLNYLTAIPANYITASMLQSTAAVKSLQGLTGDVTLTGSGGAGVSVNGNTITITAAGGSGGGSITIVQNTDGTLTIGGASGPTVTVNLTDSAITARKIAPLTITRRQLAAGFKAYGADTADYARNASTTMAIGGDLQGNLPNPTLTGTGVVPGTYSDATHTVQVVIDSKGRITSATPILITGVTPGGTAAGALNGSYPNPTLAPNSVQSSNIVDGTIQSADFSPSAVIPTATYATTAGGAPPTGNATGDLAGSPYSNLAMKTSGVAAGTYGDESHVVQFTVNAKGIVTSATSYAISGASPTGAAGGSLYGSTYPNPVIAANAITTSMFNPAAKSPYATLSDSTAKTPQIPVFGTWIGGSDSTIIACPGLSISSHVATVTPNGDHFAEFWGYCLTDAIVIRNQIGSREYNNVNLSIQVIK